ncbi:DUF2332 domain-containing protein [Blastococcus sp. CT_GayMR20]|uniref:DUF2332 domain-containing protein n=1 Tax=Blastococcus sp. CT_GayMR20 TaxID=2559609 RepID=UPI001073613C|nr:DUF2332 domain-containing protein [Blastococcus sp. CT_GayMR20]TFV83191.1 DUF2332 domain-containing protein [Blastococcus sp. CT_GayMR20]TFV83198.1 DUF2332 domain-containing protein [Blastococcus sp. CT_GayMR20]
MTDQELERLAQGYRAFVSEAAVESPVYSGLAAAVAGDRDVLRFLAGLPPGRRQPTLLFAALRFLGGVPADGAALHERVLSDSQRLDATMRARATQTNEPARCAALLPALATIGGSLALVEVGTSAGLCLYPDRYSYEYDGRPVGPRQDVHLRCTTSGPVPLPSGLPQVVARIGIDLNPLDVTDPDDRAWLRALVWPGPVESERLQRLDAAAAVAALDPPVLLAGDLVERLPAALALVPAGATPVVLHTAVLPYVPEDRRTAFVEQVRGLPVRWVAQEGAGMVPGTGRQFRGGWGPYFVLSIDGRPVARTAPHGGRIDWLDEGSPGPVRPGADPDRSRGSSGRTRSPR